MTKTKATAEVFWTAFRSLPRQDQQTVLQRILCRNAFWPKPKRTSSG